MSSKKFSSTKFWLTQFGLAGILIVLGAVVIMLRQENKNEPKPDGAPEQRNISSGLSNFYREFRMSSNEIIKEPTGDFTLEVAPSDVPLDTRLKQMASSLKPENPRWVGEYKYRTFDAGNTLRTAISQYAQQEGMQMIWDLNEDFVVKHHFQMEDTIVGSVADIANAIDSNFNGDVNGYFCPKQRTLVITASDSDYLKNECMLAK